VATAFPPAAEDVEADVAPDVEPELAVAPLLLFEVFVVVLGGGVVDGGTTLHSYSWPLNSASCPSASPYVPEVPEGTMVRSAKGSLQFQHIALRLLPRIITAIAKYFFICFSFELTTVGILHGLRSCG
jgi:hypothetical protein